jgi:formylglycine-generating enzyme required for sulfatase activity
MPAADPGRTCSRCGATVPAETYACPACGEPAVKLASGPVAPAGLETAAYGRAIEESLRPTAAGPPLFRASEEALSATLDAPQAEVPPGGFPLGDRYRIVGELGRGGMGVVYRARDLVLDEEIALKVLLRQFTTHPQDLERFKGEIKTARRITHPNVIRIHDFGVIGRDAFISMEMLVGGDLKSRIDAGPLSLSEAVRVCRGLCAGLQAAHDQGVIHRDLKPQNILFDQHGTPKLSDFGIARIADTTSNTIGFVGTPFYMAPEVARGAKADFRSDVYALGVVFYQMLTGRLPFYADSLVGIALMHANEPPPPPRSLRPDLPPAVEEVALRALEKDPERRYQWPKDLAHALDALGDSLMPGAAVQRISASDLGAAGALAKPALRAPHGPGPLALSPGTAARRVRARGWTMALGAVAAVSAALVVALEPWEEGGPFAPAKPGVGRTPPPAPAGPPPTEPTVPRPSSIAVKAGPGPRALEAAADVQTLAKPTRPEEKSLARTEQPQPLSATAPRTRAPQPSTPAVGALARPLLSVAPVSGDRAPKADSPPPAAPPPPDPKKEAAEALKEGDLSFADFDFKRAQRAYARALALDPGNPTVSERLERAQVYGKFGDMVYVPAGEFIAGSDDGDPDERPRRTERTAAFYIDRYEVSNRSYQAFVKATGAKPPPDWREGAPPVGEEDLPVSGVAWEEARAYCRWRGKRLPQDLEWEKAARGTDGRRWPWGDAATTTLANVGSGRKVSVYAYKKGRSPWGAQQMAGNVWEWTATRDPESRFENPVYLIRGGAFNTPLSWARAANKARPTSLNWRTIGLRCARSAP